MIWWVIGGWFLCFIVNFFLFLKLIQINEGVLYEGDIAGSFIISLLGPIGFVVTFISVVIYIITSNTLTVWLNKHL